MGSTTERLPGNGCLCSFWSITKLSLSAKNLVPFHSKQRAAVRTNPLPGQHQAPELCFPYFWGSQCSTYHPLYNILLQSQSSRWHQGYLAATRNSEGSSGQNLDHQQSYGLGLLTTFKPERATHTQRCRGQLLKDNYNPLKRGSSTKPKQGGHELPPSSGTSMWLLLPVHQLLPGAVGAEPGPRHGSSRDLSMSLGAS